MGQEKRKRMTKQKKLILEILALNKCHPTAEWIYQEARKVIPDISLGTVYRNLRALKEEGKIQELNYGKAFSRYDGNPCRHCHFICDQCCEVYDCDDIDFCSLDKMMFKNLPGNIKSYRLEFYGTCHKCRNKNNE